jgi:hypothetical protein
MICTKCKSPSGLAAPLADLQVFLQAGGHQMAGGESKSLNQIRKALPGVPVAALLKAHRPDILAAALAASRANVRAYGGR